jgi:hypothetical protein
MMSPEMTWRLADDAKKDPKRSEALEKLKNDCPLSFTPRSLEVVDIGYGGSGVGHKEVTGDGEMCYRAALLCWALGDAKYGELCLKILRSWSEKNKVFRGDNAPLEAAWAGCAFARSAEMMKYSKFDGVKTGWKAIEHCVLCWLDKVLMPCLKNEPVWRWPLIGNWHFSILCARMQIAILKDDSKEFLWCIEKYKEVLPKAICYGGHKCHISETMRDLCHVQFELGGIIQLPEMAYHQGYKDLFDGRLKDIYEYHARLMMKEIPEGIKKEQIHTPYGYWPEPVWEVALAHFQGRCGMAMPCVEKWCQTFRPERVTFHWGGGTLTHYKRI